VLHWLPPRPAARPLVANHCSGAHQSKVHAHGDAVRKDRVARPTLTARSKTVPDYLESVGNFSEQIGQRERER